MVMIVRCIIFGLLCRNSNGVVFALQLAGK
jgi:hypothetical protein